MMRGKPLSRQGVLRSCQDLPADKIDLKFTVIKPQGRRTDAFTKKYWAFDSFVSYDISIDGKSYHIENLAAKAVPEFALNKKARENPEDGNSTLRR